MLNFWKKDISPSGPVEFLVAGLGNPGRQYEGTRHNAGFMALDAIAAKNHTEIKRVKFKGVIGECRLGGMRTLLLKPSTFMNLSGQSVQEAMQFYKLPPERVLILFDDINLEPGKLRIRRKGSDGGHNGMKNIIYLSGSDQFPRIKLGVGQNRTPTTTWPTGCSPAFPSRNAKRWKLHSKMRLQLPNLSPKEKLTEP